MKCCFSREKDIVKKPIQKEVGNATEEVAKPALIPFLEREKPITDLDSLFKRINDLKYQIKKSTERITTYEYKIKYLESGIMFINMDTKASSNVTVGHADYPEIVENFGQSLIAAYNGKIEWERDMINTCQNELDWLQMKMKFDDNVDGHINYNFDPYKDHC